VKIFLKPQRNPIFGQKSDFWLRENFFKASKKSDFWSKIGFLAELRNLDCKKKPEL